ncbi:MAG: glycosyltransferase family 39 protein [Ardenticatenaceae bacterium]|nr:glycosyltransferase family 39 protein [Ardenticatenaceae bacterium]
MREEINLEEMAPWLVVFITLVGGVMRILLLRTKGLWLDETFSIWLANQSVGDMLHWIATIDQHPPLYYLLLHFWVARFGDNVYYVRLLSALVGAGTIPIIYLIGKRLSGVMVGLAAAVFLALSPFHIYFAQETRMYTLLTFNAAVAIYALVWLLTDSRAVSPIGSQFREYIHVWRTADPIEPKAREGFSYKVKPRVQTGWQGWVANHRWLPLQAIATDLAWVGFMIFSAATMLTHNTAVLFPLATNIFVLGLMLLQRFNKSGLQAPSLGNWIKAQIGIFLLWSPWLLAFIRQARTVSQRFWIPEPTWDAVVQMLRTFLNASAPLPADQTRIIWSLYILALCLGFLYFRKKLSHLLLLVALFAIPLLSELLVSLHRPIFYDRTLIWTTIPLFLLLAAGVAQLRYRFFVLMGVGILGAINLFSVSDYYRFFQKEDWQTPAGYVALYAEPDDLVLFNSNFVVIPFDHFFQEYEDLYDIQVEKQGVPLDLMKDAVLEPLMTEDDVPDLAALISGRDRVWLVYSHNDYTDPLNLIPQTLASELELLQQRNFYGGQVQLYGVP